MFDATYRPGVSLGLYPERDDHKRGGFEDFLHRALGAIKRQRAGGLREGEAFVEKVEKLDKQLRALSESDFRQYCNTLKLRLRAGGMNEAIVIESFAAIREASGRLLGKHHFPTQVLGGWAILGGYVAEMQTGEGKTLTSLLPACTAAMAGTPVHLITANDYLAARDAETLMPVYEWFDLSIGVLTEELSDSADRKKAYACDIAYASPSQVAFDYLRDRMSLGHRRGALDMRVRELTGGKSESPDLLMRGLCFAIVDEADSVLIDDACTPLILSAANGEPPEPEPYYEGIELARKLVQGEHFDIEIRHHQVALTAAGKERILDLAGERDASASEIEVRFATIIQALQALYCYQCDKHYIVREGAVVIIDGNTGRPHPDHAWEGGLHQMVEAKEGLELSAPRQTIARMSYQRFFRRYLHLSGMSGTVSEVASELWSVYQLEILGIPSFRKNQRIDMGSVTLGSVERKWQRIAQRISAVRELGRPVLIGTRTVAESEALSAVLSDAGIEHRVLNARQDHEEAQIVAGAGQSGAVTVATAMAGRGTDIELPEKVKDAGGLHVIVASRNDSSRVDRQLIGRCARQGDPGSFEAVLSVRDELLQNQLPGPIQQLVGIAFAAGARFSVRFALWSAQKQAERQGEQQRRAVQRFDESSKERLAFSGPME